MILVVNHIHLDSAFEYATQPFMSAAEALVLVSGVVCGIVFRRRWQREGARAATLALLQRSGKLYVASVVVVALVGALRHVPGLRTDALTVLPRGGADLYAVEGPLGTLLGVVTLGVGPGSSTCSASSSPRWRSPPASSGRSSAAGGRWC